MAIRRAQTRSTRVAVPRRSGYGPGGDAHWRAGNGCYDYGFAPFPEAIEDADAAIAAGGPARMWRADPMKVATRRYPAEGVCRDGDSNPCPPEVDIAAGEDRAGVEGTVQPFPDVTWDITIAVHRLGQHSWWIAAMTIEPREADS